MNTSTSGPTPDRSPDTAAVGTEPASRRPNVLFITADQWRGEYLSCAGHPLADTPNIDALAAEGVRFARHYSNAAPCGPSRASLLTGMYAMNHRSVANGTPLDSRRTNLALEARRLGYRPWVLGYTDTSVDPRGLSPDDPRLRTYETVMDGFEAIDRFTEVDTLWTRRLEEEGLEVPDPFWELFRARPDYPGAENHADTWTPTVVPAELSQTSVLTDLAMELIDEEGRSGRPFFLHLSYLAPHPPWRAPEGYHDLFDAADVPPPKRGASLADDLALHPVMEHFARPRFAADAADQSWQRQCTATYLGLMKLVDDNLGRLFGHLRHRGMWEDTLVVFTSDHGEQMFDHAMLGKSLWFESSYHIPLVIRGPQRVRLAGSESPPDAGIGVVNDEFTENVDIMPTILELCGAERVPRQCDGLSLMPFLDGRAPRRWREGAHWEFDFRWHPARRRLGLGPDEAALAVYRTPDAKYVHFAGLPPVFHDLGADPDELVNRASDSGAAGAMLDLASEMLSLRMTRAERTLSHMRYTPGGPEYIDP